jgi:hypothetical protein
MNGVTRETGAPVVIEYEQGLETDTLKANIGNERFSGRSVMANSGTTIATGLYGSIFTASSYSNQFQATLIGDMGSSLQCELRYASSMGETSAGGVGICQHSNGRIIDLVW